MLGFQPVLEWLGLQDAAGRRRYCQDLARRVAGAAAVGALIVATPTHVVASGNEVGVKRHEINRQAYKLQDEDLNKSIFEEAWGAVYTMYYDATAGARWSSDSWVEERKHVLENRKMVFSSRERTYDAIRDMVSSIGDEYTRFLTPEEMRAQMNSRSDAVLLNGGIGLQLIDPFDGVEDLQVLAPLPESPAEEAGINPGDYLEAIDGIDVARAHMTPDEAISLLRGPIGSRVNLTVRGFASEDSREIKLQRRVLSMDAIRSEIVETDNGKIGYARIHLFTPTARERLVDEIQKMEYDGVDAIVLDVRNCLGGIFQESLVMASAFLDCPDCVLVKTLDGNGIERDHTVEKQMCALPRVLAPSTPLAVLMNGGSASSSEVLAVALSENQRATLIGERTFGKGLIQHEFVLKDGSAVAMTVAEYITPRHHRHIHGTGTGPDRFCRASPAPKAQVDQCVLFAQEALRHQFLLNQVGSRV